MLTPEEKAHELINKFTALSFDILHTDCEGDAAVASGMCTIANAKQCALIEVDEIMNVKYLCGCEESITINGKCETYVTYWMQVKTEITNL